MWECNCDVKTVRFGELELQRIRNCRGVYEGWAPTSQERGHLLGEITEPTDPPADHVLMLHGNVRVFWKVPRA